MNKNTKKTTPVPATLWLESLGDFADHARQIEAKTVYVSVSTIPAQTPLAPTSEGKFYVLATARTSNTILHYEQAVIGATPIDALVRRLETDAAIDAEIETMVATLEAAGLNVKKGRWTL